VQEVPKTVMSPHVFIGAEIGEEGLGEVLPIEAATWLRMRVPLVDKSPDGRSARRFDFSADEGRNSPAGGFVFAEHFYATVRLGIGAGWKIAGGDAGDLEMFATGWSHAGKCSERILRISADMRREASRLISRSSAICIARSSSAQRQNIS